MMKMTNFNICMCKQMGPSGPFWTISDKNYFFAQNGQSRVRQRCFGRRHICQRRGDYQYMGKIKSLKFNDLIWAPQMPFLVPPKTPVLGVFGYFILERWKHQYPQSIQSNPIQLAIAKLKPLSLFISLFQHYQVDS